MRNNDKTLPGPQLHLCYSMQIRCFESSEHIRRLGGLFGNGVGLAHNPHPSAKFKRAFASRPCANRSTGPINQQ